MNVALLTVTLDKGDTQSHRLASELRLWTSANSACVLCTRHTTSR